MALSAPWSAAKMQVRFDDWMFMRRFLIALISTLLASTALLASPAAAAPPTITTFNVIASSSSQIDVNWAATGAGTTYTTTISPVAGSGGVTDSTATSTSYTGLTPNTAYTVSLAATDAGETANATSPAVTTFPAAPSVTIGTPTSSSLPVSWSDVGPGVTYQASIAPNDGGATGAGAVGPGSAALATTFTGLDPGKSYTVTVVATNGSGSTPGQATGSTPVVAPSGASISLGSVTSSSMVATFSADAGGGTNSYTLTVRTPNAGGTVVQTLTNQTSPATISGLSASTSYSVTVSASNGVGSPATAEDSATTLTAAPSGASISLGSVTSSSMVATFSADDGGGTNSYTLTVRTPNAGGTVVQTLTNQTSPATISGLSASTSYSVTVSASNGVGSPATAEDSATTQAPPVGAPSVTSVTVTPTGTTSLSVSWTATDGGGTNSYTTSISPNQGSGGVTNSALTSTSYSGLQPGTSYTVTVTATNENSSDAGSDSASTNVAAPSITTLAVAADGSSAIDVSWAATAGGGTNSYTTSISPNQGSGGVTNSGATSTRYTGLNPGTSYTVTLTATNAGGSDTASGSDTTSVAAASAPRNVAASLAGPAGNFVRVTWDPPADLGGGAITNYTVALSNGASATVAGTSTDFETLPAGTTVTARVTANNAAGAGAQSGPSNAVTTADVPGNVTGLTAAWAGAGNINAIDVAWNPPGFDGGDGVTLTGFVVSVSPALDDPIPVVNVGQNSVTIGGLEQGTSYTVTVRAQNQLGNSSGTTSSSVLVPSTPGTVTDLVVDQSPPFSASIVLTWDLPESDGGSPITGFSVSVDDQETQVGPAVTTASFQNLTVGPHNVTVRAITAAGLGPAVTSPNFEVKGFPPFDSEEDFVRQLYADFLRRTPDAGGLAFWTARVNDDGSNVQDIVEAFMRSPEFSPRRGVARLYFAYFNRQPDKGGFDFWTRQIAIGARSLESASQFFSQSPEFQRTYGSLSDAEFVVLVYNNVLARRPDTNGFRFWLAELQAGLNRGRLMTLFSESPENIGLSRAAVDVTVTYDGMLQREADVGGFVFWRDQIAGDDNALTTLIRQFYFSPEYAERVTR